MKMGAFSSLDSWLCSATKAVNANAIILHFHPKILSYKHPPGRVPVVLTMHVPGLWENTQVAAENPVTHAENMTTCCEATALHHWAAVSCHVLLCKYLKRSFLCSWFIISVYHLHVTHVYVCDISAAGSPKIDGSGFYVGSSHGK